MSCKLYLVPEDVINTWRAEQRENAVDKPLNTLVSQVDSNMGKILEKNISDYDKEKLYSQELGKYLTLRNQKQVTQTPIISKANPNELMASLPKFYRNKAAGLLQYLKSDSEVDWDDEGHLYIGQQKIDNSHIVDLIHDAMRLRKKVPRPQGWRELSSHLRRKNVPKELVGNPAWFTSPTTPEKTKGIKRSKAFQTYKPVSSKKRVIGVDIPVPVSVKTPRKSKVLGQKKIKQWISL